VIFSRLQNRAIARLAIVGGIRRHASTRMGRFRYRM